MFQHVSEQGHQFGTHDQRLHRNQVHLSSIDFPAQLRLSDLLGSKTCWNLAKCLFVPLGALMLKVILPREQR